MNLLLITADSLQYTDYFITLYPKLLVVVFHTTCTLYPILLVVVTQYSM